MQKALCGSAATESDRAFLLQGRERGEGRQEETAPPQNFGHALAGRGANACGGGRWTEPVGLADAGGVCGMNPLLVSALAIMRSLRRRMSSAAA